MKETIQIEVEGKVAEITLVTPGATLGLAEEVIAMPAPGGPVPPIRLPGIPPDIRTPRPPDIKGTPPLICGPKVCGPNFGVIICGPDVSLPKPPSKPKP